MPEADLTGGWDASEVERFADRIQGRIEQYAPRFQQPRPDPSDPQSRRAGATRRQPRRRCAEWGNGQPGPAGDLPACTGAGPGGHPGPAALPRLCLRAPRRQRPRCLRDERGASSAGGRSAGQVAPGLRASGSTCGEVVALPAPLLEATPRANHGPRRRRGWWPRPQRRDRAASGRGADRDERPAGPSPSSTQPPPPRAPTARAMTSRVMRSAAVAYRPIRAFARPLKGMVSVGLNALEFVSDK